MKCVYRGQMDSSRPGNGKVSDGKDLNVIDEILNNNPFLKPNTFNWLQY